MFFSRPILPLPPGPIHLDLGARLLFLLDFILQALRGDGQRERAAEECDHSR
jgi:hypothetical protein